ncbi:MAG: membrane protein insertion efficiency factor YidD [Deltaproteobacteria bacterium]|nr:membrane protein insertion efficiency factor YidD [Deltaproteobacteria bacterium]
MPGPGRLPVPGRGRDAAATGPPGLPLPALVLSLPIRFYRSFISPATPPMCRFTPTCSAYALEAIAVHGIRRGTLLAAWRVMRCQPLCEGGHDPVPPPSPARKAGILRAEAARRLRSLRGEGRVPPGPRAPRPPRRLLP